GRLGGGRAGAHDSAVDESEVRASARGRPAVAELVRKRAVEVHHWNTVNCGAGVGSPVFRALSCASRIWRSRPGAPIVAMLAATIGPRIGGSSVLATSRCR